jgi:hypothetical protein
LIRGDDVMKKFLPVLFVILGTLDTVYGALKPDIVSLAIGVVMVAIAVYILKKEHEAPR